MKLRWLILSALVMLASVPMASAYTWTSASGCWTATNGTTTMVMWNTTGQKFWTPPTGGIVAETLLVGGGGGGGGEFGGGGGGGGVLYNASTIIAGPTTLWVGVGGAGGVQHTGFNGFSSNYTSGYGTIKTVAGGGGGGGGPGAGPYDGLNGASGGGGGIPPTDVLTNGGTAVSGQGFAGGKGGRLGGGGGGGGGAVGSANLSTVNGGPGGLGELVTMTGLTKAYYGGGGGGVSWTTGTAQAGGVGGGGTGGKYTVTQATAGTAALGGGGGGGNEGPNAGGAGGSGVIIFTYTTIQTKFTTNATSYTVPMTVRFTDTSTNSPTSWAWAFNNVTGNNTWVAFPNGTLQNPILTFTGVGNYAVNLTTTNAFGSVTSATTWFNTTESPTSHFSASPLTGTAAMLVTFTFDGSLGTGTGVVYNMSYGDPTSLTPYSNEPSSTHVYALNGIYTPTLWVNTSIGNSSFTGTAIVLASDQNQQNTWYTQRLVKIKVVDAYGAPIPNANLSLNYMASTLPSTNSSWLTAAFGITDAVASDMTNSGLAMQSYTSNDGSLTFMMFPALTYGMTITNATIGLNNYQTITPSDTDYTVFCPLPYQNINSQVFGKQTQLAQNLLYVSQINATAVMINFQYQDTAAATTAVTWNVTNWNTGAVVYGRTFGNPGTGLLIDNYTVLTVPAGVDYRFAYEATRNTP